MDITSTANISSSKNGYRGVQKHVERKHENYSNQDINLSKSYLNIYGHQANLQTVLKQKLTSYIKEHDEKQKRPDRRYKNIEGFFSGKAKAPDKTMVSTFGAMDDKTKFLDLVKASYPDEPTDVLEEKLLKSYSAGLVAYAHGFNKRNTNLTMCSWGTNVDEKGAPHLHSQILPSSVTAKGKPSFEMTRALKEQFSCDDGRKAMSLFREQEDGALVRLVGKSLHDTFPKCKDFDNISLTRKGDASKLDMDTYKTTKEKATRDAKEELKITKSTLDFLKDDVSAQRELQMSLYDQNEKLANKITTQKHELDELRLKKQDSALDFEHFKSMGWDEVRDRLKQHDLEVARQRRQRHMQQRDDGFEL